MSALDETTIELAALKWCTDVGFQTAYGPASLRKSLPRNGTFADILLTCRLKTALKLLNPDVPAHGVEEVFRKFTRLDAPKELADALYEWIRKGGFPPVTIGDESLGKNWHKTIATFACLAVANRVEDIRKRRGRRQTKGGD